MIESHEYLSIANLYSTYAAAVDQADWDRWVELFSDACMYKIQPRENFERGFPLSTMFFESKGMLKDRIYGIRETLWHDPYYQLHVTSLPRVVADDGEVIRSEANYAVFRTKSSELTTVFNVGRYVDEIERTSSGLLFRSRSCIYDSELIPNSLIYPI